MTPPQPQRRQLREIADELLTDQQLAAVVALFNDQPLPPQSGHHNQRPHAPTVHHTRHRLVEPGLVAVTLLVTASVPGFLVAAALTGIHAFVVGIVLMVPAFLLFGRCWRRRAGEVGTTSPTSKVTERYRWSPD